MEAKARSFNFIGTEGLITIPFFQRSYVWNQDNWEELLADLLNNEKSHFLGSLILKQQKTSTGDPKQALVIDGQQRLTTLSILVKALYDSFSDKLKLACIDSIRRHLFYKVNETDENYFIKIRHSHLDSEAFGTVISNGIESVYIDYSEKTSTSRIISCYSYFTKEFKKYDETDRTRLFNSLLNTDNKILVVIDLEDSDNEQSIFDTINSSGVRLSAADIIKNSLFQRYINLSDKEAAIKLYNKTWDDSFLKDEESIQYWGKQRTTGRLLRDNIEILLHAIAVIKGFYDPEKHTLSDLSDLYKSKIESFLTKEDLSNFIAEISEYASIYRSKILSFDEKTTFTYFDYEQRLFHILEVFEISTLHPYILSIYKNHSNDPEEIKQILGTLECFIIKRLIAKEEIKSFNKLCKDFINDTSLVKQKISEISFSNFVSGIKSINNKPATLLLFWVELFRRHNDNKFALKELKYDYTLEHIMPQKWEEFWTTFPPLKDDNGNLLSQENLTKNRLEKIYSIGNMTLLTGSLNTSLRNYEFQRKMRGEGRKNGIIVYADLSITSVDIVEPFLKGDTNWDETKIEARTTTLLNEIINIWNVV